MKRIADPTYEEIAERSAQVRESWDDDTHKKRAGCIPDPWFPPKYICVPAHTLDQDCFSRYVMEPQDL